MTRHSYLVTEGVHDIAFLGKLLTVKLGFKRVKTVAELDAGWQAWFLSNFKFPRQNPTSGALDISRLSVQAPEFYARLDQPAHMVCLANAAGIAAITDTLDLHLEGLLKLGINPDAVGVVLDADEEEPLARFSDMAHSLASLAALPLPKPEKPGDVRGAPRTGIFILPDGERRGTLEDVLLAVGRAIYPALHDGAEAFVEQSKLSLDKLRSEERKEINKPAGTKKAKLAAMGAILKPGKSIRATLDDHRWVSAATLAVPEMAPCIAFLEALTAPA